MLLETARLPKVELLIAGHHGSKFSTTEPLLEAVRPDYIFVSTMGSADAAKAYMLEAVESNPAWAELSAVKNGRYIFLPKELFHYKPLNRWDESYAYLADRLCGKTE